MRWVLPICLAACGGSNGEPQDKPAPPATGAAVAVSDPAVAEPVEFGAPVPARVAKPAHAVRLWNARPGVPIARVFAVEDGGAAVSIDESSHMRLWPTLDGKREPWVVPLTMPVEIAIARDGDGFALAALDQSGGLELVGITAAGEMTTYLKEPPEPGFAAAIVHDKTFLLVRADQLIEQRDLRGQRIGTLVPERGEHVVKLLHRNGRTLALVRAKDGVHGRWLATDKLAWGDATPTLKVELSRVHLSPDHKRISTFRQSADDMPTGVIVDLATGKAKNVAHALSNQPPLGLPIGFAADNRFVLAFADFEFSTLAWWKDNGYSNALLGGNTYELEVVSVDNAVVTDTNVIAPAQHELAIATANTVSAPSRIKYLGYRTTRARAITASPAGPIATIGGAAMLLDDHVHVAARLPASESIAIGGGLALVRFTTADWPTLPATAAVDPEWLEGGKPLRKKAPPGIALYDLAANKELQRWRSAKRLQFEPASQLMAFERGSQHVFAKLDPQARQFGGEQVIKASGDVMLLDPKLAGGKLALLVDRRGDALEIRAISDLAAPLPEPTRITGKLEAIDRAGRVYVREDADTVVVHGGTGAVRFTGMTGWSVRPDATGARVAAFARSRLMLLDERGTHVWSVGFPGITDAAWSADGALVVLAGDLAKLDAATGQVLAAQCGWNFGLRSPRPELNEFPSTNETLCDR